MITISIDPVAFLNVRWYGILVALRNDIGGVSTPLHPDTGRAQIFIYDAYPGGIGIAEKGFDLIEELWQTTLKAITECPCQEGCPSCIQSPKCGNNNKPLDKKAAQMLLEGLLSR